MKKEGENIIVVKDLVKKFGSFVANDHLTFEVKRGEIFGFLGANGAGKTTAIKILCGLSFPTSGELSVAGFDIYTQREQVKRNIGYMSQRFSLYDDLTVFENIRFYGGIYGLRKREIEMRAADLMNQLGFENARNKLIRDIPLGWKQKLAFSVAILHNPKIVFLDEPTGGVDPITRRQFWDMIYEAAHRGITVFVTTHYMDEAEYCDRVSIMVDGRIAALDTPDNLKKQFGVETMNEVFIKLARPNPLPPPQKGRGDNLPQEVRGEKGGRGILARFKPSVSKRNLLFIAGLAWTTAGGILAGRGLSYVLRFSSLPALRIAAGLVFGGIFYVLLFAKISRKHIKRIRGLNIPYPCAFSFFNIRGYLMMAIMISGGIMLRTIDMVNKDWLYNFYIAMGVPLLISASRFFWFRATNKEIS